MPKYGSLYLIPNIIADETEQDVIGEGVRRVLPHLTHFLAEDLRTARRYLKRLDIFPSIEPLQFEVLNKDTDQSEIRKLMQPLYDGHDMGVVSDSGCPGVADPGALAVAHAHRIGARVIPLVGPSSILMALMASGLNGQQFTFHGYLPIDQKDAAKVIKDLERESRQKKRTQIFIETPYRSNNLLQLLMKTLTDDTLLSVSSNITDATEYIRTLVIAEWKRENKELPKAPAVFSFLAR